MIAVLLRTKDHFHLLLEKYARVQLAYNANGDDADCLLGVWLTLEYVVRGWNEGRSDIGRKQENTECRQILFRDVAQWMLSLSEY